MNHPVLVGVAMVALSVGCYWGLMKLEAIKPKKKSKGRKKKRKQNRGKGRKFFKRLFHFTRKEIFLGISLVACFTLLFAVIIKDLLLAIVATAVLVILHFKIQSLKT